MLDFEKLHKEGKLKYGQKWITRNKKILLFCCKDPRKECKEEDCWIFMEENGYCSTFCNDGKYSIGEESKYDIVSLYKRKVKRTVYINCYESLDDDKDYEYRIFSDKKDAERYPMDEKLDCIEVEIEFTDWEK